MLALSLEQNCQMMWSKQVTQWGSRFFLWFLITAFSWSVDSSQIHFCPYVVLSWLPQPTPGEAPAAPRGTPSSLKNPQNCWGLEVSCSLGPFISSNFSWGSPDWGTLFFLPLCVTFPPPERLVLKDINHLAMLQVPLQVVEIEINLFCVRALLF